MFVVPLIAQKILSAPADSMKLSDVAIEFVFEQAEEVQISEISVEIVMEEV